MEYRMLSISHAEDDVDDLDTRYEYAGQGVQVLD